MGKVINLEDWVHNKLCKVLDKTQNMLELEAQGFDIDSFEMRGALKMEKYLLEREISLSEYLTRFTD